MSSGSTIPYHLRQNKAVERVLFEEQLKLVSTWLESLEATPIEKYRYIGFGGPFLEDFKSIHRNLKIEDMTFSTSIVIAHYKTPLHKVLDFSRELLAQTKSHFDNKNGVGIIVMSDSAINAQTICRYDDLKLLKQMKEAKSGMSLHYKLQTIFNYLDNMSFDDFLTQKKMIKVEIKRLLKREDNTFDEDIYHKLIDFLDKQKREYSTNNYEIDFDNFIAYLKTLEQLRKVL